jgi:hypothetical protein
MRLNIFREKGFLSFLTCVQIFASFAPGCPPCFEISEMTTYDTHAPVIVDEL